MRVIKGFYRDCVGILQVLHSMKDLGVDDLTLRISSLGLGYGYRVSCLRFRHGGWREV